MAREILVVHHNECQCFGPNTVTVPEANPRDRCAEPSHSGLCRAPVSSQLCKQVYLKGLMTRQVTEWSKAPMLCYITAPMATRRITESSLPDGLGRQLNRPSKRGTAVDICIRARLRPCHSPLAPQTMSQSTCTLGVVCTVCWRPACCSGCLYKRRPASRLTRPYDRSITHKIFIFASSKGQNKERVPALTNSYLFPSR